MMRESAAGTVETKGRVHPYPEYRDSGTEFLGDIPVSWRAARLGVLGSFSASGIDKKIVEGEPMVRLVNYTDVYGSESKEIRNSTEYMMVSCPVAKSREHALQMGDVLFTPSSETPEEIGFSAVVVEDLENTVYSYHLIRFRPRRGGELDLGYCKYFCNASAVLAQFTRSCKGTTRQILTREDFRSVVVPVPPAIEQRGIAAFLDRETAKIDALIGKKRRLIELLQERRTALITRAVTEGLDASVPMKDSGVEWLGRIPAHWEVAPLKRGIRFIEGPGILAVDFVGSGVPLLRIAGVGGRTATLDGCNYLSPETVKRRWERFRVRIGDLLISGSASTGFCSEVDERTEGAVPYTGIIIIRTRSGMTEKGFVRWFLLSPAFQTQVDLARSGSTIQHFGPSHLSRMKLLLPPSEEQSEIASFLDFETAKIDTLIAKVRRAIGGLEEYRTALISAAVTGKIDIREETA